ncbi:MAG: hypothetical protein ABI770_06365 [Sphingomicrobium sp.]
MGHSKPMKDKEELASSESLGWTRAEDYVVAMARRRTERRKREPKARTQPESPRLLLSTLPFLALIAAMALLAVGIMILAFPGAQPRSRPRATEHQQGVAARGWFQEAKKEFK